ncbi:class I SAM-dependent methyltransferase [Algoriphagus sp. D3-2-R+10]|uniref:class I SAM-dependent methyltransferase n=1 Tax=Algoriphagus aurantiacus TaxID=3103948 RepID=UPI002B387074|nr:class I SAM-dependent methyltransferase [Algoriphagus sp. D3-2-R+10]MEB2776120.1 class I SAM-dependent methyltransferase [Algoriphagus sp. D3-2-R+10]
MKDHYSLLAPFYNPLVRLVFGDQLQFSKTCFLRRDRLSNTLIIGGGDGRDYQAFQRDIQGEYWEISEAMMKRARQNLNGSNLDFKLGYFRYQPQVDFGEILLHFVLDTMSDGQIKSLLMEVKKCMKPESRIYFADFFAPKKLSQKILNYSMISFFRIVVGHIRPSLPKYEDIFLECGFRKTSERSFLDGWVKAQVWLAE